MSERETSLEKSHLNKRDSLLDDPLGAVDECLYFSRMIDEAYRLMSGSADPQAQLIWLEEYEKITTDPDDE